MSEKKKYRTWTVGQKLEIVLAGLRGDRSIAELCREHQISENLYYTWREKLLEGGAERLSVQGGAHRAGGAAQACPRLGADARAQDVRAGDPGKRVPDVGVTKRFGCARQLVVEGHRPSALARILQISRQAIYRIPTRPPQATSRSRPPVDDVEAAIVEVAEQNPTDGYRIVTAWVRRRLGRAVNRKRVLRVMRQRTLIQRRTHEPRRRRPGFFKVERPGQLWHLDMTSVWVAEHGWVYLNSIIDCCTREIVGWELSLRCRAVEAITVIERAVAEQCILPGTLTLGTDNGSAFTARATRLVLSGLGVAHRRGGYHDPESQAFIESWFRYLKERCVWRHEFETLDQAREVTAAYIAHYHHRPHSRLNYRTPSEVRQTWDDAQDQLQKQAA